MTLAIVILVIGILYLLSGINMIKNKSIKGLKGIQKAKKKEYVKSLGVATVSVALASIIMSILAFTGVIKYMPLFYSYLVVFGIFLTYDYIIKKKYSNKKIRRK